VDGLDKLANDEHVGCRLSEQPLNHPGENSRFAEKFEDLFS
jgi:hypothetical protein